MNTGASDRHLTDAELFDLAAPASGEPEPLPRHLSQCDACSRALQDWKAAMRELAMEDAAPVDRRPAEEWLAAREATMSAIRRARPHRPIQAIRWAVGVAAALLVVTLAMPRRRGGPAAAAPAPQDDMAFASAADRDDDALLRDAEYLAQGGDDHADIALEESL